MSPEQDILTLFFSEISHLPRFLCFLTEDIKQLTKDILSSKFMFYFLLVYFEFIVQEASADREEEKPNCLSILQLCSFQPMQLEISSVVYLLLYHYCGMFGSCSDLSFHIVLLLYGSVVPTCISRALYSCAHVWLSEQLSLS